MAVSPRQCLRDLREGTPVDSYFVCTDKQTRTSRDGQSSYVRLTLLDASGEMGALYWEEGAGEVHFGPGDVIAVTGVCANSPIYGLEVRIEDLTPLVAGEFDRGALDLGPEA